MFCKGCGKKIEATASVCPYCKRSVEKLEGGIGFFDLTDGASKDNGFVAAVSSSVGPEIQAKLKRTERSLRLMKWVLLVAFALGSVSLCIGFISYAQVKEVRREQEEFTKEITTVEQELQDLKDQSEDSFARFFSQVDKIKQSQDKMSDSLNEINEQIKGETPEVIAPKDAVPEETVLDDSTREDTKLKDAVLGIIDRSEPLVEGEENENVTLFVKGEGDELDFKWQKQNSRGTWVDISLPGAGRQFVVDTLDETSSLSFVVTAQTTGKYRCILSDNGQELDTAEFEVVMREQTATQEVPQDNENSRDSISSRHANNTRGPLFRDH